jgi:hypothetical protein
MKQPSSNSDGEKQQAMRFLLNGIGSSEQNQPIRQPSTHSESVQRTTQPPSPRRRLSHRNSNDSSVYQPTRSQNVPDEVPGLTDLIWQYFEPQIREALLEAQESLGDDNDNRSEQLSNGKQEGK